VRPRPGETRQKSRIRLLSDAGGVQSVVRGRQRGGGPYAKACEAGIKVLPTDEHRHYWQCRLQLVQSFATGRERPGACAGALFYAGLTASSPEQERENG